MAIRIATRANISDDFKSHMIDIYKARLVSIKQTIDEAHPHVLDRVNKELLPSAHRLVALINDKPTFDRELTKLRSLPYTAYEFITHKDKSFMYGRTKEITIVASAREKYDAGEYGIYAPYDRLVTGSVGNGVWHFIPFRDPKSHQRTPHHHGQYNENTHPLEQRSATCWGSFGSVITSILCDGDVVELFRTLHLYVSRYDPYSPLGGIRPMKFVRQV